MGQPKQPRPSSAERFDLGWACFKAGSLFTACLVMQFSGFTLLELASGGLEVGAFILGLAQLLYMLSNRRLNAGGWGAPVIGVLLSIPFALALFAYTTDAAEGTGDTLLEHISDYTKRHGEPPTELTQLCPEFLDQVPTPQLFLFSETSYHYDPKSPTTIWFIGYGDLMHIREGNGSWAMQAVSTEPRQ